MIDEINLFDQPVKTWFKNIWFGEGDDYTAGSLIDYPFFKNCYKLIAIGSRKQQKLDADPKAVQ